MCKLNIACVLHEVLYTVSEHGVATITLNAPKRMNTMSKAMHKGVFCALEMAEADPAVAVVRAREWPNTNIRELESKCTHKHDVPSLHRLRDATHI